MDIGHCSECRFWGKEGDDYGKCMHKQVGGGPANKRMHGAFTFEQVALHTKSAFGCVNFEQGIA
ncbi:MAG: hypothetical protein SFW35_13300 [Chitinophagales bacterium]|nr:hypothetical protein [Chitinophagales bacterium]